MRYDISLFLILFLLAAVVVVPAAYVIWAIFGKTIFLFAILLLVIYVLSYSEKE